MSYDTFNGNQVNNQLLWQFTNGNSTSESMLVVFTGLTPKRSMAVAVRLPDANAKLKDRPRTSDGDSAAFTSDTCAQLRLAYGPVGTACDCTKSTQ